jgi:hypothetical protein
VIADLSVTLDVDSLQQLAGYAHWIPQLRGYAKEFMQRKHPGWAWNDIIPVLIAEGILSTDSGASDQRYLAHGLSISESTQSVKITHSSNGIKVAVKKLNSTSRIRS